MSFGASSAIILGIGVRVRVCFRVGRKVRVSFKVRVDLVQLLISRKISIVGCIPLYSCAKILYFTAS